MFKEKVNLMLVQGLRKHVILTAMATLQVDADGNRIETDILISGYLRQDIENQLEMMIPPEIKGLCFQYWFIKVCDECKDDAEFAGQTVKRMVKNQHLTIYGRHSVQKGLFEWRLMVKSVNSGICIGIIEDKDEYLKKHIKNYNYDLYGYGCWWYPDGTVSEESYREYKVFTKTFQDKLTGKRTMQDVIVGIKINMEKKKISYSIDGDEYIDAPITLTRDKYRLAVSLFSVNDQIELL